MNEELKKDFINSAHLFRKMREVFPKNTELSSVETMILNQIFFMLDVQNKQEVTISDIVSLMGMTKPALSQCLNALEKKEFIFRSISSSDRRVIRLNMTPKGRDAIIESHIYMDKFLDIVIEKFGCDNLKSMIQLMSQMFDIIDKIDQEKR